jgi:hypothetical protein
MPWQLPLKLAMLLLTNSFLMRGDFALKVLNCLSQYATSDTLAIILNGPYTPWCQFHCFIGEFQVGAFKPNFVVLLEWFVFHFFCHSILGGLQSF